MAKLFEDCINCEERALRCHSSCKSYLEDKAIKDGIKVEKELERLYSIVPKRARKTPSL